MSDRRGRRVPNKTLNSMDDGNLLSHALRTLQHLDGAQDTPRTVIANAFKAVDLELKQGKDVPIVDSSQFFDEQNQHHQRKRNRESSAKKPPTPSPSWLLRSEDVAQATLNHTDLEAPVAPAILRRRIPSVAAVRRSLRSASTAAASSAAAVTTSSINLTDPELLVGYTPHRGLSRRLHHRQIANKKMDNRPSSNELTEMVSGESLTTDPEEAVKASRKPLMRRLLPKKQSQMAIIPPESSANSCQLAFDSLAEQTSNLTDPEALIQTSQRLLKRRRDCAGREGRAFISADRSHDNEGLEPKVSKQRRLSLNKTTPRQDESTAMSFLHERPSAPGSGPVMHSTMLQERPNEACGLASFTESDLPTTSHREEAVHVASSRDPVTPMRRSGRRRRATSPELVSTLMSPIPRPLVSATKIQKKPCTPAEDTVGAVETRLTWNDIHPEIRQIFLYGELTDEPVQVGPKDSVVPTAVAERSRKPRPQRPFQLLPKWWIVGQVEQQLGVSLSSECQMELMLGLHQFTQLCLRRLQSIMKQEQRSIVGLADVKALMLSCGFLSEQCASNAKEFFLMSDVMTLAKEQGLYNKLVCPSGKLTSKWHRTPAETKHNHHFPMLGRRKKRTKMKGAYRKAASMDRQLSAL